MMACLFKTEMLSLRQNTAIIQTSLETLVEKYVRREMDYVAHSAARLQGHAQWLHVDLSAVLDGCVFLGRHHWKRPNVRLRNGIDKCFARLNRVQALLGMVANKAGEEQTCEPYLCEFAVQWYRFTRALGKSEADLKSRPARRKRVAYGLAFLN